MSFKSTSLAAAVALTLCGAGAEARDLSDIFTLRGYGTAGLVYSDEDQADFVINNLIQPEGAGYSETVSAAVDSKNALQLDMTFTDRLSGVVQLISEGVSNNTWDGDRNKRFVPSLEWANLSYRVTDELTVRAGRIVLPFFMAAEYRKVGFASHWLRTPVEVYGVQPFTSSDGADVSYNKRIGSATNTLRAHYGKQALRAGIVNGPVEVWGVNDAVEVGALTVRAAYMKIHYHALGEGFGPLFNGFAEIAASIPGGEAAAAEAIRLLPSYDPAARNEFDAVGVGFSYDVNQWFVLGEVVHFDTGEKLMPSNTSGYLSGGYRWNQFTPYATYARTKMEKWHEDGIPLAGLPLEVAGMGAAINGIIESFGADTSQQTFSLGLRWDFMSSMALKAQYDYVDLDRNSKGMLVNMQPGFKPGGNVNVISIALDYVF
jgi:opacity protein-like surface antigen